MQVLRVRKPAVQERLDRILGWMLCMVGQFACTRNRQSVQKVSTRLCSEIVIHSVFHSTRTSTQR